MHIISTLSASFCQAESWQDKMKAGLNQGLQLVQEQAQKGYEATKERVSTYRAGQELLDKGGEATESAIRGKMMAKATFEIFIGRHLFFIRKENFQICLFLAFGDNDCIFRTFQMPQMLFRTIM